MSTRKILLTGGAGYIGSHVYVELIAAGYDVVILDNFCNSSPRVIARLEEITGRPVDLRAFDVLDAPRLAALFASEDFSAVIHFAALKAVGESVERPLDYFESNISGLIALLRAMDDAGVRRLVYSSSATIYGAAERMPITEEAPRGYLNPYGFTKLTGEQILEQLETSGGAGRNPAWEVGILRYFNPAGAHPSGLIGEDPRGKPNNLVPFIGKVATGVYDKVRIFGDDYETPDGTGVRDYIHVCDLAEGHVLSLKALERDRAGHVVNLGVGRGISVREMIAAYGAAAGFEIPAETAPRRPGDIAACWADPSKAEETLGFRASRDLDEICRSSWAWLRQG